MKVPMRITFNSDNLAKISTAVSARENESVKASNGIDMETRVSKSLDDNKTYSGKKSVKSVIAGLEKEDVKIKQNYMTVMSASMSEEDFNELVKNNGEIGSVDVKDSVTILDKIKLEVIKSGKTVEGFTDTLDKDTIKAMTGLESLSGFEGSEDISLDEDMVKEIREAVSEMKEVTEMSDGMMKDFITSDKELSIHNLYLSKHSNIKDTREQGSMFFSVETPGYLAKKSENTDREALKEEVKNLLKSIDVEPTKENIKAGMWLVDNDLYVTEENIEKVNELSNIKLPMSDEKLSKVISWALEEGKLPKDAEINRTESIYNKAIRLTEEFEKVMETPFLKETRILEETRLKMTTEANLMLLKSGVKIDTTDLESYVEKLKELEASEEFKEIKEVIKVEDAVKQVKNLPIKALWEISEKTNEITLEETAEIKVESNDTDVIETVSETTQATKTFEEATLAYEAVGTKVRRDYGDSIKKAFGNIPEILEELKLEVTPANVKAVKILGYNNMAINEENIIKVKEADRKITNITTRLTPSDTLTLIREHRSPLKMSIDELNDYLDSKENFEEKEIEKYSKFLYKLERDNEITPMEREEYIDVYRLMNRLEKTDYQAIGGIINSQAEYTFENLRILNKSVKHKGMDVKIGEVVNEMVNAKEPDPVDREYIEEKFTEIKEALRAPEEIVNELVNSSVTVSSENLEAALMLRKKRGEAYRKATALSESEKVKDTVSLAEKMDDKESSISAYEKVATDCKRAVYEACMHSDNYLDVKALQLVHRQISVSNAYKNQENYEVPMEIGGKVTSVNVKIVHNDKEDPNTVISLEDEKFGRITARLSMQKGEISGYIACNLTETVNKLSEVADTLGKKVSCIYSKTTDTDLALSKIPMKDNKEDISSKDLYDISKKFLQSLKGKLNED